MIRNLFICISLVAAWLIADLSCHAAEQYQKILIVSSKRNDTDKRLFRNISAAFGNVKLNYRDIDAGAYGIGEELQRLNSDDLLVIATNDYASLVCQDKIVSFVAEGGMLFLPVLGTGSDMLLNLAGVRETGGSKIVSGFCSSVKLFPGLEKPDIEPISLRAGSIQVSLDKNATVIVAAKNNCPLVWKCSYGKGKVMVANSGLLTSEKYCGVMMQLTSLLNDYFITTVFNAKVVFIDDFPAPVPEGTDYTVSSNYDGMSYDDFYKEIWWPQIKELAVKHNLKYTCLVLANRDSSVFMPPAKTGDRTKKNIRYYGRDIIKNGHELGIHGYNNAPLVLANTGTANLNELEYPRWKSAQDMEASLTCLRETLDETIGQMDYFTYAPPMNMLSGEGKKAVLTVFPGIRCFGGIAASGSDVAVKKDDIIYQEAGMDPDFPQVYSLPRSSQGELYKAEELWRAYNHIAYYGLFSHFLHSDDFMDTDRSGNMDWRQLHDSLDKIMADISVKFPFLRGMTARDFVQERLRTDKIKIYSRRKGNEITVEYENGDGPLYHYLRINNGMKVKDVKNGKSCSIDAGGGLYLLEGLKSPLHITLE